MPKKSSARFRIYPSIGIARLGNGPAEKEHVIFSPEIPWANLFETDNEYLMPDGKIATVLAFPKSAPQDAATSDLVNRLRDETLPALESQTRATYLVGGATAEQVGRIAAAGGHVLTDLRPADRGLEDLFFQLTA